AVLLRRGQAARADQRPGVGPVRCEVVRPGPVRCRGHHGGERCRRDLVRRRVRLLTPARRTPTEPRLHRGRGSVLSSLPPSCRPCPCQRCPTATVWDCRNGGWLAASAAGARETSSGTSASAATPARTVLRRGGLRVTGGRSARRIRTSVSPAPPARAAGGARVGVTPVRAVATATSA